MSIKYSTREDISTRLLKTLFSRIKISSTHFYNNVPCWEWTGYIRPDGYGRLSYKLAHRLMYSIFVEEIPSSKIDCDHLCRRRHCVNPCHLEAVTHRVNMLRGKAPAALNALKTHCHRGHPLSGNNLFLKQSSQPHKRIYRQCLICRKAQIKKDSIKNTQRRRLRAAELRS
jgi:hypothetical protein